MKKKVLLGLLFLLVGSLALSTIILGARSRSQAKALDEAVAKEKGFRIAEETSAREREGLLGESVLLKKRVRELREELSVKPTVVTRKVSEQIEVPVETIVEVPVETIKIERVPAECRTCLKKKENIDALLKLLPPVAFRVETFDAILRSDAGALVASGEVELFRTSPPPEISLGRTTWKDEDVLVEKERAVYKRFGYFVDLDWSPDPDSLSFVAPTANDPYQRFDESLDDFRLAGGAELRFARVTTRLGVHSDSGVRVGFSYHGRKR